MKIAHVNQDPGISPKRKKGAAIHINAMRQAFGELGAEVVAIDVKSSEAVLEALEVASNSGPLDLIYERYALGCGAAFEFSRANNTAFVLEVNSPLEQEADHYRNGQPGPTTTDPAARGQMFAEADMVLAVSTEVGEYAIGLGATEENLRVQPNGVDLGRFQPRLESDDLRNSLIPEGVFVLGFHGRVRPWHNLPMLVATTRALLDEGLPVHLMLVGRGDYEEHVAEQLPSGSYTLIPWTQHEDMGSYVACFDALVMTHSARSPFYFSPLKLFEAMAAGVPPIAPRLGDLSLTIEDGETGLLFRPDDPHSLGEAIRRLYGDHALRAKLSKGAQVEAQRNTWRRIAARVLEGTSK